MIGRGEEERARRLHALCSLFISRRCASSEDGRGNIADKYVAKICYLPLLIHSIDISRKDSSKEEAKEELARPELVRRYSARQFVLLVPFAVAVMAVLQSRRLG